MTRRGVCFLIFFALLLFLALATGSGEIYLVTFTTGLLLTFALVSALAGVFALRIEHQQIQTIAVRGDSIQMRQQVNGRLVLPAVLYMTLLFPAGLQRQCAVMLWGRRHKAFGSQPLCPHRGIWPIGIHSAKLQDVFGFFSFNVPHHRMPSAVVSLTVYPRLHEIEGIPPPPMPVVEYSKNKPVASDHGDSFADTRLYRDGDSLKRIHWKLSIRTQELHTRQYEMSVDRMAVIVVDTQALPDEAAEGTLNYADTATECAAALTLYYAKGGHAVRLIPTGDTRGGLLINTAGEFPAAHTLLAITEFGTSVPVTELVQQLLSDSSYYSAFYVITSQPTAELIDLLSRVAARRCLASIVYPEAHAELSEPTTVSEGVRLIPIGRPQDITQRLGERI